MRLYIVCAALIAASGPVLSQSVRALPPLSAAQLNDPEAVYAQFHRAMMAGDLATMERHASASYTSEMLRRPQSRDAFKEAALFISPSYSITGRAIGTTQAVLDARGQAGPAYGGGPAIGKVIMVKQGQEWRVDQVAWVPVEPDQPKVDPPRPVPSPTPPAKLRK